jgi:Sister chromatid cohesion protein Dcc1
MEIDNVQHHRTGVAAISQPTSSLELNPVAATQQGAESAIRNILPVQDLPDSDASDFTSINVPEISLNELLDDLPFPKSVLTSAIHNLMIFETISPSPSYHPRKSVRTVFVPTPRLLLQAYKHLYNASLLTDIDLSNAVTEPTSLTTLLGSIRADEGEMFTSVAKAILARFTESFPSRSSISETSERIKTKGKTAIQIPELCSWFGKLILYCHAMKPFTPDASSTTRISLSETEELLSISSFHEEWLSLVPQSWHSLCNLTIIEDALIATISVIDGTRFFDLHNVREITNLLPEFNWYVELCHRSPQAGYGGQDCGNGIADNVVGGHGQGKNAAIGGAKKNIGGYEEGTAKGSDAMGQGKRRWHEKFGAMRDKK